jgi:hypothetical protein
MQARPKRHELSSLTSRGGAFPPVDGFCVAGHAAEDADTNSAWLPPAGEAERPEFPGVAVVVVDRLIYGAGVDLAGPVAVNRLCDVAEQPGQLRLW